MTQDLTAPDPARIAARFLLPAPVAGVEPFGKGLINATYRVTAGGAGWVLQRINGEIFPDPERIMENLSVLSGHLASRADTDLRIPAPIPAADGTPFVRDPDGGVWRLMELIPNSRVLARIATTGQAREVGRALGTFHRLTADLAPSRLSVTLPGFHFTPRYLGHFDRVIAGRQVARCGEQTRRAFRFVATRRGDAAILETAKGEGRVPMRVVHGDPKLDNILFDGAGTQVLSLIDLDTVQPGLMHYDIGDCLRSCCNRGGESPTGEPRADFQIALCRGILEAYAGETRDLLSEGEVGLIYDAVRLIPFELGLRFLTDHLEGDRYFRISAPGQNLRKALVQFALVEDIERKEREIRRIIGECFGH